MCAFPVHFCCSHMQPVSAGTNVNEIFAISTHGWIITENIMKWLGHLDVQCVAVSLYLDVCDFVAARANCNWSYKFVELVDLVVRAIQHTLQCCNVPFPATNMFGGGNPKLLVQELAVSEVINWLYPNCGHKYKLVYCCLGFPFFWGKFSHAQTVGCRVSFPLPLIITDSLGTKLGNMIIWLRHGHECVTAYKMPSPMASAFYML